MIGDRKTDEMENNVLPIELISVVTKEQPIQSKLNRM